ncbi:MAG: hypothetical protein EOO90_03595 [Pedobacter sp.]|nr:MAG: hypothetical protein EOO90_03595 [Pedobacter sp.]
MESRIKVVVFLLVLIWGLGLGVGSVQAQTGAEFLRQKKTQEKYLLKQLAYLELYGSELRKGYKLAKEGLGVISDFTSWEFKLHEKFFDALATVSSVVRRDFRVAEIAKLQIQIRSSFSALAGNPALSGGPDEKLRDYIGEVRVKVIQECNEDLDELLDVVLAGEVEMNDSERLARLKVVHEAMVKKAEFSAYFCSEVNGLLVNRKGYRFDIESIRRFYEK